MPRRLRIIALLAGALLSASCGSPPPAETPPSCSDGQKDGAETGVDCGGGACPACTAGMSCLDATDCASGVCSGHACAAPACGDKVRNGAETDVDCGGPCPACAVGKTCAAAADCGSGVCSGRLCAAAACSDKVKNGSETDVDCGGPCPSCANGKACQGPGDCASANCSGGKCAAPTCAPTCTTGSVCTADGDCGSGACQGGRCVAPACAPACAFGIGCGSNGDCASGLCTAGKCVDVKSCQALLTMNASAPTGVYEIDPDGPNSGLAPFKVYCDMTTAGGGWTTLPLLFNNPAYWSITHPGNSCITVDMQDNIGSYRQYHSSNTGSFTTTYLQFLPPIPVTTVQLVSFNYTNSGSYNSMDFVINGLPSDAASEGWYFADAMNRPAGYAFTSQAQCVAQAAGAGNYQYFSGPPPYCSRDNLGPPVPVELYNISQMVTLSATVPSFNMALVQGCGSTLGSPATTGEQFRIATAPGDGGVWRTGIMVR